VVTARLNHEHVFLDTGRSMTVEVVDKSNVPLHGFWQPYPVPEVFPNPLTWRPVQYLPLSKPFLEY
jgi:hypothetical protein